VVCKVNIFVIEWSADGRAESERTHRALLDLVAEVPTLDEGQIQTWRSADGHASVVQLVTRRHADDEVSYAYFETNRMALFAGRPIAWKSGDVADGLGPLDPRFYLAPPASWAASLDGRCVAARYDGPTRTLEVFTSPAHSYHVFVRESEGVTWLTNRPALLARLGRHPGLNPEALGSFFACGHAVGGTPLWNDVTRLDGGSVYSYAAERPASRTAVLPTKTIASYFGAGLQREEAGRTLVGAIRAFADWPGRERIVQLSGGRDSRVICAGAAVAGIEFASRTLAFPGVAGFPDTDDVVVARRIASLLGVRHEVTEQEPGEGVRVSARVMRLLTPGLVSLGDTGMLKLPPNAARSEIVLSGLGGELARALFGSGESLSDAQLVERFYRKMTPRWPRPIVTPDGVALVRSYLFDWVARHRDLGVAAADLPDLFCLLETHGNWAAPAQCFYELVGDVTTPFWTAGLLKHAFALPISERQRELFHYELLMQVAPELTRVSFVGVDPAWPTFRAPAPGRGRKIQQASAKLATELRRRTTARLHAQDVAESDRIFADARAEARECVAAFPDHAAWAFLDRRRVARLLAYDPLRLDPRSRRLVWRLVSVFAAENR